MTARPTLTAFTVACVVASALFVAGAAGVPATMAAAPRMSGELERSALHGSFWRPAGSLATRPALRLVRASWAPSVAGASD